jgi:thiol-disulfide isomerase/thioredoxin
MPLFLLFVIGYGQKKYGIALTESQEIIDSSAKYGTLDSIPGYSVRFSVMDANGNGIFNDPRKDFIGFMCEHQQATTVWQDNLVFSLFDDVFLRVDSVSPHGTQLFLTLFPGKEGYVPKLRLFDIPRNLPLMTYSDTSKRVLLHSLIYEKEALLPTLIVFWSTWCVPCIEELEQIPAFIKRGYQILYFTPECSTAADKVIKQYSLPVNRTFIGGSYMGYPYGKTVAEEFLLGGSPYAILLRPGKHPYCDFGMTLILQMLKLNEEKAGEK